MNRWLFTCEHGGDRIPARFRHLFDGAEEVLCSHRGCDTGALQVFRVLAKQFADYSRFSQVSRLLIDLNRSVKHKALFSEYLDALSPAARNAIRMEFYTPWRSQVHARIKTWRKQGHTVLHISVHSFTPEFNGERRNCDIGLLYDPAREVERTFCRQWQRCLKQIQPDVRVRLNYPYRGKADGFTTELRGQFPTGYAGIELELNAGVLEQEGARIAKLVSQSLGDLKDAVQR